mmetsp:Transcript_6015/g.8513  ORF Transcript_6015/g.8513 Transcript_6015/m.8513 type:complete len:1159 (+) Transcript_6015:162-3638(+)
MFGNQFDDPNDMADEALQEELGLTGAAGLSRLAASRAALAYGGMRGAQGAARQDQATARRMDASNFMSMLQGGDMTDAQFSAAAPYGYQRQQQASPYQRAYLQQQSAAAAAAGYGLAPGDAGLAAQYRRTANFGYGTGVNPDQRYGHMGFPQGAPSARDFAAGAYGYQGRQVQEYAQQAALMERQLAAQQQKRQEEEDAAAAAAIAAANKNSPTNLPSSSLSYLPANQQAKPSTVKSSDRPRPGRGGRGPGRGGRGRGRGGRGRGKSATAKQKEPSSPAGIDTQRYFPGCVRLGLEEDKYWLSELQVYLRSNFAEAFGATEQDIAAPMHGRNKPIALGQVGIRCMHCKNDAPADRGQQATSYPSLISGIYNSVQQMLRLHFDCCLAMPAEVRQKIEALKVSSSARGGRKQYWIDSAKRLGLVDTPHGIHWGRDPYGAVPPLTGPSIVSDEKEKVPSDPTLGTTEKPPAEAAEKPVEHPPEEDEEMYPLVIPDDKPLISDYLYLTLEQMQPCRLMEADKVGCYKGRKVGFPGLACKHCVGQAGCGRYFPASEASLSQTTTSQTIMNHVRNCRRCPIEIRENLELMKRARMGPDGKRADKPKHGGRKVFFHRLWCRIQRVPMDEEEENTKKKGTGTWSRQKKGGLGKKSKAQRRSPLDSSSDTSSSDLDDNDDYQKNRLAGSSSSSSETETDTEESVTSSSSSDGSSDDASSDAAGGQSRSSGISSSKYKGKRSSISRKKKDLTAYDGCVRLTKPDDAHWLSDIHCYVRSELVEVFSLTKDDSLNGYGGRKEPAISQVGVRCVFCKNLEESERPIGYMYFPDSVAAIHTKVNDLIRLHFPSCPAMPEDVKETFKSLRGFGAKAIGDQQGYWIDAAKDIGMEDVNPEEPGEVNWGITFRRDPLQPSPADELDRENVGAGSSSSSKTSLVRSEDRGLCTDHVTLLLRQVKPCRFKKSDRRGGPGARGRDRVIGFPGLSCKHCITKNNFGRYFPVSAKNLTDNTANSLQAHVATCSRCPDSIKASLAYLLHRSVLQKSELSGSWKKTFFKRVWDRLHVERAWSTVNDGEGKDDDSISSSSDNDELESKGGSGGTDSDDEELGEDMTDLIKAAAHWLSEQEESTDSVTRSRARGRGLPGKRLLPFSPRGRGRGSLTSKRRRVHF